MVRRVSHIGVDVCIKITANQVPGEVNVLCCFVIFLFCYLDTSRIGTSFGKKVDARRGHDGDYSGA